MTFVDNIYYPTVFSLPVDTYLRHYHPPKNQETWAIILLPFGQSFLKSIIQHRHATIKNEEASILIDITSCMSFLHAHHFPFRF
jgi:hypothetical protein